MSWTNSHSKLSWLYREIPPQKWTPSPLKLFTRSSTLTTTCSTDSWLDDWDHQPEPGVMLQAVKPWDDHELAILVSHSDTLATCLCTILFDSEFAFHTAYTARRADITCCDYRLSPYL